MEQQVSMNDAVEVEVVKSQLSPLEEAVTHAAHSFGDAVDRMVAEVLAREEITPDVTKTIELLVIPPQESGWSFTVIYDSVPVGSFEVGVYAVLQEKA